MALARSILLGALALGLGCAQAALHDRGGGLIYDDALNVTWLQNANFGAGSAYDDGSSTTDGLMSWTQAMAWAASLSYGGFDDWRLPVATPVRPLDPRFATDGSEDYGYNITRPSSEMAYLYYVTLGGIGALSPGGVFQLGYESFSRGPFYKLAESAGYYWTETQHVLPFAAYSFNFSGGNADANNKISEMYAFAVRDGDIAAVPEPGSLEMTLMGLALLAFYIPSRR